MVVFRSTDQQVAPRSTGQDVAAAVLRACQSRTGVEPVVFALAVQVIGALATVERVPSVPAGDRVAVDAAVEQVVAAVALQQIAPFAAADPIDPASSEEQVLTPESHDHVGTIGSVDRVELAGTDDRRSHPETHRSRLRADGGGRDNDRGQQHQREHEPRRLHAEGFDRMDQEP